MSFKIKFYFFFKIKYISFSYISRNFFYKKIFFLIFKDIFFMREMMDDSIYSNTHIIIGDIYLSKNIDDIS